MNKRLRYGTFSTAMILATIGLFVLINLVVDQLNISHDLTQDRFFTLSEGSRRIARELSTDITIYALFPTGQEEFIFTQLLEEYSSLSPHIRVEYRDPLLNPQFVRQFERADEAIDANSIIVVGPYRHRVIHSHELVTWRREINPQTFAWQNTLVSINLEPHVTNAINFVTTTESPIIYHMVGNEELPLAPGLMEEFQMANYEVREVNLVMEDIPEDIDILLVTLPRRDWTPAQATRIYDFLRNDGRALLILGPLGEAAGFPLLEETLGAFGIVVGDYIVLEGHPGFFIENPLTLVPEFVPHQITENLIERQFRPFLMLATGIDEAPLRRANTNIYPLITTSDHAYGKRDPNPQTINREEHDVPGPFNLAVAIEDRFTADRTYTTRMVVLGSGAFLVPELNTALGGTNWSFLVDSVNWLRGEPSRIHIPPRAPSVSRQLIMTQSQANFVSGVSVFVLPIVFVVAGLVVWLRRRNA